MGEPLLRCVEHDPDGEVRAAVVWLHGLGADGHDFEPVLPYLDLDPALGVRFVFPHAPRIPVTVNGGMVMPAWYDIYDLSVDRRIDEEGILRSAQRIGDLLRRERERGIPSHRILLAGFSQGGAVALEVALRWPERLGGIVALSCYLVREESLEDEAREAQDGLPVFQAHGESDPLVPLELGVRCRDALRERGHPVEWRSYPMAHEVCGEEIREIGAWIGDRLAE